MAAPGGSPPVITTNGGEDVAVLSVQENNTAVTDVDATDPDGGTLTFGISSGADAAKFSINATTGVLTFSSPPNFESPTDAGGNNVYDVVVQVSDGSLTDTQAISVTVTGVNEPPTITSDGGGATVSISVAENTQSVTNVDATDPDASTSLVYSISGTDAARFTIQSVTGVVTFLNAPDFENPTDADQNNVYDVTVQVSDGSLTDTQAISVTVTNTSASCSTVVSSTNNSGTGSLRAAISCANSNDVDDVIIVPAGQYLLSGAANDDANVSGDLDLTEANHSVTIRGAGWSKRLSMRAASIA